MFWRCSKVGAAAAAGEEEEEEYVGGGAADCPGEADVRAAEEEDEELCAGVVHDGGLLKGAGGLRGAACCGRRTEVDVVPPLRFE